ncbi:MAG: hypothetical protein Q8R04_01340 [Nanoarchaeota archaeon]|nr:hypothetical protein [Nanoarchaeota archaeon]
MLNRNKFWRSLTGIIAASQIFVGVAQATDCIRDVNRLEFYIKSTVGSMIDRDHITIPIILELPTQEELKDGYVNCVIENINSRVPYNVDLIPANTANPTDIYKAIVKPPKTSNQ